MECEMVSSFCVIHHTWLFGFGRFDHNWFFLYPWPTKNMKDKRTSDMRVRRQTKRKKRETEKTIGTQLANWTKHWKVEKQHIHTWNVYGDLRIQKPHSPLKQWQSVYLDVVMWISDASNLRFGRACCAICCLVHVWWYRACMNIGPVLNRQRHPVERYKKTKLSSV